ncbi:eryA, partial [Symbiodinium necroappetens]
KGEKLTCPRDNRLGTSYVDAIADGDAGLSNYMLSYSWGYPVGDIADTLSDFFGEESLHEFIWICCLCINQHR